jgi:hypothetical protein
MAQTTRSSSSRATRGRPRTKRSTSTSRNGSTSKSRSTSRSTTKNRSTSRNGASATTEKVSQLAAKAKPPAKAVRKTGEKVADVASKAKTPLVAGGAALAGIAGGVALNRRAESKRPTKRFRAVQLPKSLKNIDLDQLVEAGRRVRSLGEQVGDVADTAEKTRKKHK